MRHLDGQRFHVGVATDLERTRRAVHAIDPSRIPGARALFALFGEPAWTLRCDARDDGGTWLTLDTPGRSRWLSRWLGRAYLRMMRRALGAPVYNGALPGDELLHEVRYQRTHTGVIEAAPEKVWPWLVQMGCRRAGWYSYDRLDNAGVRSAERIVPELQQVHRGDLLPAAPRDPGGFAVLRVDRPRALVLGSPDLLGAGAHPWDAQWSMTWSFVLEPIGEDATNLIVRVRAEPKGPRAHLAWVLGPLALAHEIMERAQLRNLKSRVEAAEG